jgi:hypothetical protein
MAKPLTPSEARANLYRLIDETNESHRPVVIAGKRGRRAPGKSSGEVAGGLGQGRSTPLARSRALGDHCASLAPP